MTIESVKLEVSKGGLVRLIDNRYDAQTDKYIDQTAKFSTPDGEGDKLRELLDRLKIGDTVRLVFEVGISAPSEYRTEKAVGCVQEVQKEDKKL